MHVRTQKSCVSVMASNFPELRGTAIGITKSLVGLSAALTAAAYSTAFSPNIVPFLRAIALSFVLLWTTCGYIIRIVPQHSSLNSDARYHMQLRKWRTHRFSWLNAGVASIALVLLVAALNPTVHDMGNSISLIMLATLIIYSAFPGAQGLAEAVGSDNSTLAEANENLEVESEQDRLLGSQETGKGADAFQPVFPSSQMPTSTDGGSRLLRSWYLHMKKRVEFSCSQLPIYKCHAISGATIQHLILCDMEPGIGRSTSFLSLRYFSPTLDVG